MTNMVSWNSILENGGSNRIELSLPKYKIVSSALLRHIISKISCDSSMFTRGLELRESRRKYVILARESHLPLILPRTCRLTTCNSNYRDRTVERGCYFSNSLQTRPALYPEQFRNLDGITIADNA